MGWTAFRTQRLAAWSSGGDVSFSLFDVDGRRSRPLRYLAVVEKAVAHRFANNARRHLRGINYALKPEKEGNFP
mgnify:CR=1 FL=1